MTLTTDSFEFVADLVRRRSAIQLEAGKEYLVESRLAPLARRAGLGLDEFVRSVRSAAYNFNTSRSRDVNTRFRGSSSSDGHSPRRLSGIFRVNIFWAACVFLTISTNSSADV